MRATHLFLAVFIAVNLTVNLCHAHRRPWERGHRQRQRDESRRANPWTSIRDRLHRLFGSSDRHHEVGSRRHPLFNFDLQWGSVSQREKSWWEGANVCKTESEQHTNDSEQQHELLRHFRAMSQSCDVSETAYKCKVTEQTYIGRREVTTVYHCCHGYSRQKGDFGCPTRHDLTDLVSTLKAQDLTDFSRAVRLLQLTHLLEEGNFTVFAPVNGAFSLDSNIMPNTVDVILGDAPSVIAVSESTAEAAVESLQDMVLGHLVDGSLTSATIEDEQLLATSNDAESSIRVNYFSRPDQPQTMMANCVPVISRDILATNGVLHSVAKALTPVTDSLLDIVRRREDLSTLKTVLAAAEYVSTLNEDGTLTLLAPTNSAFEMMNPRLRDRLLKGDKACVQKILQNHLLSHVICSGALTGESRTRNLLEKLVNLTQTQDGKLFADGAQMVQTDVMATNGVMHVVDQVLVPEEALGYLDVLEQQGFSELLRLIEKAGLTKTLENTDNVTVFAPTNEAIQSLPDSVKDQLKDKDVLKEVLSFHVSPGVRNCHRLHDNMQLPTLSRTDVRVNSYQASPFHRQDHIKTAQCTPITQTNIQACNGRINVIGKVMLPPPGNVIDVLALDRRFSRLVSLIKKAGVADILQEEGPFTIFAPTNKAFAALDQMMLEDVVSDPEELAAFIKRHVFQNALCCAGIRRSSLFYHPQVRVMSGERLKLQKRGEGQRSVGGAKIVTCDRTATNGVVHELDSVLLRAKPQSWGRLKHGFGMMFG